MNLTNKQLELLRVIVAGNGDDDPADLDEILDRVRYETTKQSLQFSIRALIKRELIEKKGIEKRRGRQRQVIAATAMGKSMLAPRVVSSPAFIETEAEAFLPEFGEVYE